MVLFVSSNHPQLRMSNGRRTIGACDDGKKCIYIQEGLPPMLTKKVLCHELTHAAMFSYNVELSLAQEEVLADIIATYGQEIVCKTNKLFNRLKEKRT